VAARRELTFLLAAPERRLLQAIAARLPRWVTSDGLTILGMVGALGTGAAYALSTLSPAWLWAASALLVVQWFGDSLDGTLARVRRAERPRYGYYLDHIVDAFSTVAIGAGIGRASSPTSFCRSTSISSPRRSACSGWGTAASARPKPGSSSWSRTSRWR